MCKYIICTIRVGVKLTYGAVLPEVTPGIALILYHYYYSYTLQYHNILYIIILYHTLFNAYLYLSILLF